MNNVSYQQTTLGEKYFLERVKILLSTRGFEVFTKQSWRDSAEDLGFDVEDADRFFSYIDVNRKSTLCFDDIKEFISKAPSSRNCIRTTFLQSISDPGLFLEEREWVCPFPVPPFRLEPGLFDEGLYVSSITNFTCNETYKTLKKPKKKRYLPGTPRRHRTTRRSGADINVSNQPSNSKPPTLWSKSFNNNQSRTNKSLTLPRTMSEPLSHAKHIIEPTRDSEASENAVPEFLSHDSSVFSLNTLEPPSQGDSCSYQESSGNSPSPKKSNKYSFPGRTTSNQSQRVYLSPSERKIMATLLRRVPPGSVLFKINGIPVEKETRQKVLDILSNSPPPYHLTFKLQQPCRRVALLQGFSPDNTENFSEKFPVRHDNIPPQLRFQANKERGEMLQEEDLKLFEKEHILYEYEAPVDLFEEESKNPFYGHCVHCPSKVAWYLSIHRTMEDENFSALSWFITVFIFSLIFLSTIAYIGETVPEWKGPWWVIIEYVVSIVFTVEYCIRILTCRAVWPYFIDPLNMIDFLAVLPFWLEQILPNVQVVFLRVIRVIRLARILRLLKTPKFRSVMEFGIIMFQTLTASCFAFQTLILIISMQVVIFASFLYVIEFGRPEIIAVCEDLESDYFCSKNSMPMFAMNISVKSMWECQLYCESQVVDASDIDSLETACCEFDAWTGDCWTYFAESAVNNTIQDTLQAGTCYADEILVRKEEAGGGIGSPFTSIPESMWWSAVTMFMVGYGEIYPVSWIGQFVCIFCMLLGLLVLAMPVIIMGFEFHVALQRSHAIKEHQSIRKSKDSWEKLINQLNRSIGFEFYEQDALLAMIKNGIHTTRILNSLLSNHRGWSYLPFEEIWMPGAPRITQFQLFVLWHNYGLKLARDSQRKLNHLRWLATLNLTKNDLREARERLKNLSTIRDWQQPPRESRKYLWGEKRSNDHGKTMNEFSNEQGDVIEFRPSQNNFENKKDNRNLSRLREWNETENAGERIPISNHNREREFQHNSEDNSRY